MTHSTATARQYYAVVKPTETSIKASAILAGNVHTSLHRYVLTIRCGAITHFPIRLISEALLLLPLLPTAAPMAMILTVTIQPGKFDGRC